MQLQRNVYLLMGLLPALMILTACEPAEREAPQYDYGVAVVHSTEGNDVSGVVRFNREGENIRVSADISGLPENSIHGFHVHEYGDCTAEDATSAGGHFDPHGIEHGGPDDEYRHVGDMGNLESDDEGNASINYLDEEMAFSGAANILGKAVIVHAEADDLESQPTGDAGARIGCGVIGVANPDM